MDPSGELSYLEDVELDFRAREPIHPRPLSKEELDDLVEALRETIGPLKVLKEQANVSYERIRAAIREIRN